MKKEKGMRILQTVKMKQTYIMRLAILLLFFLGGLQQNYAVDLGELRHEIGVEKSAVGCDNVKAWDKLSGLTGTRAWTRTNIPLLERMSGKPDAFMDKVKQYYSTHQMPTSCATRPKCIFQGNGFTVHFDDFGHPRFEGHVPEMNGVGKVTYNPDAIGAGNLPQNNKPTLGGSNGTDIADANRWIKQAHPGKTRTVRPDGTTVPQGRIEILDKDNNWIECTWHHHEDGRNLIPVPSNIHNRIGGGAGHTGGKSVIDKGIKDFFPGLQF